MDSTILSAEGSRRFWSKHVPGFNIKAEVTAGSVTNLIQVAKLESDIGLAQGDSVADAVTGANAFPKPLPLSVLAKMYPNVVHLVTVQGSGVDSVSDLLGKKVSVGPPGSGNAVTAWKILDALGIGEDDFVVRQLNYAETANGLKDGIIDAGFIAGGVGIAAIVELAAARDVALVPFTDEEMVTISARIPAYSSFSVPRGVYRGVNEPVQTPTLWNFLVVHESLDEETAYSLLRAIFDHRAVLESISQVARFIVPETAADVGDLPLHAGARRY